jgi:cell shape-determining protein MreC
VLVLLMLVSLGLLFLSRLQHSQIVEIRFQLAELMAPVLKAAVVPLEPLRRVGRRLGDYLELSQELDRLRAENQRLRGWEGRASSSRDWSSSARGSSPSRAAPSCARRCSTSAATVA